MEDRVSFEKAFCGDRVDLNAARELLRRVVENAIDARDLQSLSRKVLHVESMEADSLPVFDGKPFENFYIESTTRLNIDEAKEVGPVLLEEKGHDMLEGLLVREDSILLHLVKTLCPEPVATLDSISDRIFELGIEEPHTLVISTSVLDDLFHTAPKTVWKPASKTQVLAGHVGTLSSSDGDHSVTVLTDSFRYDTLRVLDPGDCFLFSAPAAAGTLFAWPVEHTAVLTPEPVLAVLLHVRQRLGMQLHWSKTATHAVYFEVTPERM